MNSKLTVIFNDNFNPISFSRIFSIFPGLARFRVSPAKVLEPVTLYLKRGRRGSAWLKSPNRLLHGDSRCILLFNLSPKSIFKACVFDIY